MVKLFIRFNVMLDRDRHTGSIGWNHGPLFHRWLPDGEKDAIELPTEDSNISMRVWFERFGYNDGGFIRFNIQKKEVEEGLMSRQAVLDAGPLYGLITVGEISADELKIIEANLQGDPLYISLAKRIVGAIYAPMKNFLNVLRIQHGQYWLSEFEQWDSRKGSLGAYCSSLQCRWNLDNGKEWQRFIPDAITRSTTVFMSGDSDYLEYISKENWQGLKTEFTQFRVTLAGQLILQALRYVKEREYRLALIEGVSALEVAMKEFYLNRLDNSKLLKERLVNDSSDIRLPERVIRLAAAIPAIQISDIERSIQCISLRNQAIHEGEWVPPKDIWVTLHGLLSTVSIIISGSKFKFPSENHGNQIY